MPKGNHSFKLKGMTLLWSNVKWWGCRALHNPVSKIPGISTIISTFNLIREWSLFIGGGVTNKGGAIKFSASKLRGAKFQCKPLQILSAPLSRGAILSVCDFRICTSPPPSVNNDRYLTIFFYIIIIVTYQKDSGLQDLAICQWLTAAMPDYFLYLALRPQFWSLSLIPIILTISWDDQWIKSKSWLSETVKG